jgi:hypothetical protein
MNEKNRWLSSNSQKEVNGTLYILLYVMYSSGRREQQEPVHALLIYIPYQDTLNFNLT